METYRKYNRVQQLRGELGRCQDPEQTRRLCKELVENGEQADEWIGEAIESALKANNHDRVCLLLDYYKNEKYSALFRRCSDETLMPAIQVVASRVNLVTQDLRGAFERALRCGNFSLAKWIYDRVGEPDMIDTDECEINNQRLANNTEEIFSMLEWVKSIKGSLPLSLLESAARTGSQEIMRRMEAVCDAGDLKMISDRDKAKIAWCAVAFCGDNEFANWILERMGTSIEQILQAKTLPWPKPCIIGVGLRGEMLTKVIEYVAALADEEKDAEFVREAFVSGNFEAVQALHNLIGFTTHYISIRTDGFEWMASSLAVVSWVIETLGFNVELLQTITTVSLNYGTEKAEELLHKLQSVEPNAIEFMRPLLGRTFSQVWQSQWEHEPKRRVLAWLADLFNLTAADLEEDGAVMIANSPNSIPPEIMAWFLERFNPHWSQVWVDRIYGWLLWKKTIPGEADSWRNVETLELLNSKGLVAENPQQILTNALGQEVCCNIDEFAVEWLMEKFRLTFELTEELILNARYKTTRWLRWVLRRASNIKVKNGYLKLIARLNLADILAEHYSLLVEDGEKIYKPLREACKAGDVDVANYAVDEIIRQYGG